MRELLHSGRRAFLRGASGAVLALPLLEYTHGRAFAGARPLQRFLTVFEHGGTVSNMYQGWPGGARGAPTGAARGMGSTSGRRGARRVSRSCSGRSTSR